MEARSGSAGSSFLFYADMDRSGAANAKSTTKDVLALINRLAR
jgi:hypothetical protein